ncbi:MAG: ABC transporter permease [Acidimicrobiales bacterium]|jgi:simple sugar transport system permease protein|nr:ABC transporter permease [Acidimicrobiaceae bacterium]MDP6976328.1 ABC transporter permease [Acidimicrobiales bacterium]
MSEPTNLLYRYRWWFFTALALVLFTLWTAEFQEAQTTAVLAATLRQSTPLVLGALCGILGERSGVINIGIEGQMLLSAFAGFLAASSSGDLLVGVATGVAVGMLMGAFLAFLSVSMQGDQIIAGTVLNISAMGITSFFFQQGRTLPSGKTSPIELGPLSDLPVLGRVFFSNRPLTYLTLLLVPVLWYGLFRTTWGLRTRAVGEHPSAAETVGVSVAGMRYLNLILGGGLAGLAGAYLSLESVGSFERLMTNGRGFVALAVMIFGRWNPVGAWGAALLFGYANAVQTQFQFRGWLTDDPQFVGMIPFVVTIVVVAGFVGRARPPAAIGQPYSRE